MFMHANQRDKFQRSKRQRECDVDLAESEESEQEEFEEDEMIELAEDLKEEFAFGKFRDPKRKGPDTTLTLAPELETWAQTISELPASDRESFHRRVQELVIEKERERVERLIWKELDIGYYEFDLPTLTFVKGQKEEDMSLGWDHIETTTLSFTCNYLNVKSSVTIVHEHGVAWTFDGFIIQVEGETPPIRFHRSIHEFEGTSDILEEVFIHLKIEDVMVDKLKLMHTWMRIIYTQQWDFSENHEFLGKVSPIHYYKNRRKTWAINVSRLTRKEETSMKVKVYADFFQAQPTEMEGDFPYFVVELPALKMENSFYDMDKGNRFPRYGTQKKNRSHENEPHSFYRISPWADSATSTWLRDPEDDSQIQELNIDILESEGAYFQKSWNGPSPYCVIDMRQLNEWMISEIFSILGLEDMAGSEYGWFHDEECPPPKPIAWRYGQIVDEYFNAEEDADAIGRP